MGRKQLSVILVVCVVRCLAMTYDELEDFADYLKKTSQLSPTLKKGVNPDDYDEDETVSDHAWEDSGKFEGDLILNERQRRLIVENVAEGLSRNGIKDGTKRWPNNEVVFYIQVEHFTSDQVDAIRAGIEDLTQASCVKFRPYRKGDRDAVVIQGSRRGCFSQVGYQGGYQVLNLSGRHPVGRGCFRHGTVVHELLHTLGFYHMQSSPDRDDYVDIIWSNIVQPARHNFRKYNSFSVSDFGVGYDYDSVLHYSRRAFSSNGQDTIVPKQSGSSIGQRVGLSDKDTQKLNKMYCDAESDHVEADENSTKKNKKKKNKPFDGHGIGYHQGKAVAIKILPAAETYKIADVPSFHVFDYFSKAPEILPSSEIEGFRIGKEIAYSYNPPDPSSMQMYKAMEHNVLSNSKSNEVHPQIGLEKHFEEVVVKEAEKPINVPESNVPDQNINVTLHEHDHSSNDRTNSDIDDAFDRLMKIIKTHVYPSQNPDLSIYKPHEHYEYYHEPSKHSETYPLTSLPLENEDLTDQSQEEKTNSAIKFIDKLFYFDLEIPKWNVHSDYLNDRINIKSEKDKQNENLNKKLPVTQKENFGSISPYHSPEHHQSNNNYDDSFYSTKTDDTFDTSKYYKRPKYDYEPYTHDDYRVADDYNVNPKNVFSSNVN